MPVPAWASIATKDVFTSEGFSIIRLDNVAAFKSAEIDAHKRLCVISAVDHLIAVADPTPSKPVIRIYDTTKCAMSFELHGHDGAIQNVCAQEGFLASSSADSTCRVWSLQRGLEVATLVHKGPVMWCDFSPHASVLACATDEHFSIVVWDVASTRRMLQMEGHTARIQHVQYSPGGRTIASGSADHSVRVWNATSGAQLACMRWTPMPMDRVAFNDSGTLLCGSTLHRIWDCSGDNWCDPQKFQTCELKNGTTWDIK